MQITPLKNKNFYSKKVNTFKKPTKAHFTLRLMRFIPQIEPIESLPKEAKKLPET